MEVQVTPTIGRIVHFLGRDNVVCPAIITRVWSALCVNLQVIPDHHPIYWETSVEFDAGLSKPRTWAWPSR